LRFKIVDFKQKLTKPYHTLSQRALSPAATKLFNSLLFDYAFGLARRKLVRITKNAIT
jgi:hypothetical protein